MPFTNSPDKYFTSGGDPAVLLAMMKELRISLLSLNKHTPFNSNNILDVERLKRFAKLKLIAYNYRMLNTYRMGQQDDAIKRIKLEVDAKAKAVVVDNTDQMKAQNNLIMSEIARPGFTIGGTPIISKNIVIANAIYQHSLEENKKVKDAFRKTFHGDKLPERRPADPNAPDEIKELLKNDDFIDRLFVHYVTELKKDSRNKINDSKYKITKAPKSPIFYGETTISHYINRNLAGKDDSTAVVTSGYFPQHGKPFDNLSAKISDNLSNMIVYETNTEDSTPATQVKSGPKEMFRGWGIQQKDKSWIPDPMRTYTKETPFSKVIQSVVKADINNTDKAYIPPGAVRFFIEKYHGRYGDGSPYKKNGVIESQRSIVGKHNLTNRMIFGAYIDNFNDSYSPQWNQYDFIGRSESVPVYKGTKRTMTLTFSIVADYSKDLMLAMEHVRSTLGYADKDGENLSAIIKASYDHGRGFVGVPEVNYDSNGNPMRYGGHIPGMYTDTPESLWHKLSFLAQCAYPYYRPDGKMKEQPIIRVRVADFYDITGYIENYQLDMNEFDHMIDLNPSAIGHIPFSVKVTLGIGVIHADEPNSDYWGFYNRREFDNGEMDPQTGRGINKETGDSTDKAKKNSPTSFDLTSAEGMLDMPEVLKKSASQLKEDTKQFKMVFDDFKKIGIRAKEAERKRKAETALKMYLRVMGIAEQLWPYFGLPANPGPKSVKEHLGTIGNDLRKGDFKSALKDGKNLYNDTKKAYNEQKRNFDTLYGNTMAVVSDVVGSVTQVNNELKQIGVNLPGSDALQNTIDKVKEYTPMSVMPKTIGEILDKNKG